MTGRLTNSISTALTTSAFLLALAGAACSGGGRGPGGGGDTGGAGGEEEPTGGKIGGHVSPDAASGGKGDPGTGGSDDTGGSKGTGGSTSTGGSTGTGGSADTGGSTGTGGSTVKPDAGADSGTATGAPTFTQVYTRIMAMTPEVPASSCWGPCHAGPGTAKAMQKIDMTTQAKAYPGVMKLVVAGMPAKSTLYNEINQGKMPEKKPKLPAALIKLVSDWITAGAKND